MFTAHYNVDVLEKNPKKILDLLAGPSFGWINRGYFHRFVMLHKSDGILSSLLRLYDSA